jgi:hypothetical protein
VEQNTTRIVELPLWSVHKSRSRFSISATAAQLQINSRSLPCLDVETTFTTHSSLPMSFRSFLQSHSFSISTRPSPFKSAIPFPTVHKCPSPTCSCPTTPELDIDQKSLLGGSIAPHAQHVVIATGRQDWTSRIENDGEDTSWGNLVRGLKVGLRRDVWQAPNTDFADN